jgi:tRNA threonylcarbamoyladenosine biosynthesis protein TsaB
MPLILSIETSTKTCSVALSKAGEMLACIRKKDENYSHAERLHSYISELFAKSEYSIQDLVAIAVSKGPGSYTGLRIGVSAAKGLAFSLNIPLIGVDTLQSICLEYKGDKPAIFIPVMDARREEVFFGVYNALYQPEIPIDFHILTAESFREYYQGKTVVFVGNAIEKVRRSIGLNANTEIIWLEENPFSAKHIAALAYHKFIKQDFEDTAYFEPFYLKDFVAGKKKA